MALQMIAESVSDKDAVRKWSWIKAMFRELERRISFLGAVYKKGLERTREPVNEIK
jgi:hypothetical protein